MKLHYTKGYKYQTEYDYEFKFNLGAYGNLIPPYTWGEDKLRFIQYNSIYNIINIMAGYAWDGPSGPTKDTKTNMRASLEHDVLYQLLRLRIIPLSFRDEADRQFDKTAKKDGMSWWRHKYYLFALRNFASFAANPKNKKKVYTVGK